jgi:hypothetical protein
MHSFWKYDFGYKVSDLKLYIASIRIADFLSEVKSRTIYQDATQGLNRAK